MPQDNEIDIVKEAVAISKLLAASGIKWPCVGAQAVGIYGYIRATEDVDIVISPDDLEKLDLLLKEKGFIIHKDSIDFKDGFKLFRRVKIVGSEYFVLDILIPSDNFSQLLENRLEGLIEDATVYVISKQDLVSMKRISGRDQDMVDIAELEKNER